MQYRPNIFRFLKVIEAVNNRMKAIRVSIYENIRIIHRACPNAIRLIFHSLKQKFESLTVKSCK
jgi:hypothetical protein